jgi:putative NADH-flavin reductase
MVTSIKTAKRLFVLGATGGAGKALVDEALDRGHRVTAFVRSPQKLGGPREGLTILRGDPLDKAALRAALPGHDAVLSALGPPGPGPTTIAGDAARSTVDAMTAVGLRRLLVVGVAVLFQDGGVLTSFLRHTLLRNVASDSAEMERLVTSSDLEWTIARPPRLTNGPLTGHYAAANGRMPGTRTATASISRADVAHFLLEELERGAHIRQIVGLASASARASASAGSEEGSAST